MSTRFVALMLSVVSLLMAKGADAQTLPAEVPAPDAAAIVREVRAAEGWIDHVESLNLRIERHWHVTPRGLELRKQSLHKQFPDLEPTTQNFPELVADATDHIETAFDKQRLYTSTRGSGWRELDERIWDGRRAFMHEKYPKQEHYAFDSSPGQYISRTFLLDMMWPRAGVHAYWWEPKEYHVDEDFVGHPEDFRITGKEQFHGKECWVLECDWYFRTWHVGVADHHLYGEASRATERGGETQAESIVIQVAKSFGKEIHSSADYYKWLQTLPAKQSHEVESKWWKATRPLSRPYTNDYMDDYREVAKDCWMPMTQGYDILSDDGKEIASQTTLKVQEVTVNQPLPDAKFQWQLTEGIEVHDWGHQPPLHYKYKKHFEPAEWQAILDKAAADAKGNEEFEHAGDALVGKAAPEFPKSDWLNSAPLTLAGLKGKVVVLDFFAEWCGPCRNDLPVAADLFAHAAENGLTIIGVHASGSEKPKIEALVKQFDLKYPIYIDCPDAANSSWGELMKAYHIQGIPQAFVIGPDGKIAGHGTLAQVAAQGRTLVPAKKD